MRQLSRAGAVTLIAVSLFVSGIPRASGTNWSGASGATGCAWPAPVNKADNGTHLYYYDDVPNSLQSNSEEMIDNVYQPISSIYMDKVNNETSVTDMVVHAHDYTSFCGHDWSNLYGLASCGNLVSGQQYCDKHNVYLDTSDTSGWSDSRKKSLTCHEYGHTFGLLHRDDATNACMVTYLNDHNFPNGLSQHDIDHLNAHY